MTFHGSGRAAVVAALALGWLAACGGDSSGPDTGDDGATLAGTVQAAGSQAPLEGATITAGSRQATSDADGRFELTGLSTGSASVEVQRPGYEDAQATVTIAAGPNSHDFTLTPKEVYAFSSNAVYAPAGATPLRGTIVILGGPPTTGFVTGEHIAVPGRPPEQEQAFQALGSALRQLAASAHVALYGSNVVFADAGTSDDAILAALGQAAELTGHPELATAPALLVGLSAGAREAGGFIARHPERGIGLLLRVPVAAQVLSGTALGVPTFIMQAQLDAAANNPDVNNIFLANRSHRGRWALAVEPGVTHEDVSGLGNGVMVNWLRAVLQLRLSATAGAPLVPLDEASGWMGNQTTLDIAPWGAYAGDRATASWILSESAATAWKSLATPAAGGGGGVAGAD